MVGKYLKHVLGFCNSQFTPWCASLSLLKYQFLNMLYGYTEEL